MASTIRGDDNFDSKQVVGQNQTWTDLTGQRTVNQQYINTTGRPIQIIASIYVQNSTADVNLFVDGLAIGRFVYSGSAISAGILTAIVPDGSNYSVDLSAGTAANLTKWTELR
jgi:hypothetical protein